MFSQTDLIKNITYIAALLWLWWLLLCLIRARLRVGTWYAGHLGLLAVYVLQGIFSLVFSFLGLSLSYLSLCLGMVFISCCLLVGRLRYGWFVSGDMDIRRPTDEMNKLAESVVVLAGYVAASVAGLVFFSVDLIPSSMTGDPARHFLSVIDLRHGAEASAFKPLYYIWSGALVSLPIGLAADKLFVIFNVISLGLAVVSVEMLAARLVPRLNFPGVVLMAVLVAFGYHYFALQYGYYTLLLSSAYAFCCFYCLTSDVGANGGGAYSLATFMLIGVALTHSYFVPEITISMLFLVFVRVRHVSCSLTEELKRVAPYWAFSAAFVVLCNPFLVGKSPTSLEKIVSALGFGTENLIGNLSLVAAVSLPFLVGWRKDFRKQSYIAFLIGAGVFTFIMWDLALFGYVNDYYVNRNLIVLLPLLSIGFVGALSELGALCRKYVSVVCWLLTSVILVPYLFLRHEPLALSRMPYLDLLKSNSGFVYWVNFKTAKYSPLQLTDRDRDLMRSIGKSCGLELPNKLALLGTDHEVTWFAIYTGIDAPLVGDWNQFIQSEFNQDNYLRWKLSGPGKYLALIKHINYLVPNKILSELDLVGEKICEGDSFVIYRRRSIDVN